MSKNYVCQKPPVIDVWYEAEAKCSRTSRWFIENYKFSSVLKNLWFLTFEHARKYTILCRHIWLTSISYISKTIGFRWTWESFGFVKWLMVYFRHINILQKQSFCCFFPKQRLFYCFFLLLQQYQHLLQYLKYHQHFPYHI